MSAGPIAAARESWKPIVVSTPDARLRCVCADCRAAARADGIKA